MLSDDVRKCANTANGGRRGRGGGGRGKCAGREGPKGANQIFEKKNGQHFPFANGKGAKVHFSKNIQKPKQTNISKNLRFAPLRPAVFAM